ncbi:unnamed protein product [Ectocarpus sp. CCAP 1310/34]|nr:unnamed protein product [Ectocarpus sp. CCAP 1310/34]
MITAALLLQKRVRRSEREMTEPLRYLLFENGAALAVFGDRGDYHTSTRQSRNERGNSAVVLEPSGACFTQVRQDGTCHRQLSDFCRRDLIPHVAAASSFRNAHSPRPYLSQRIHATLEQGPHNSSNSSSNNSRRRRRRRTPSRIAHWPAAAEPTCCHSSSNSSSTFVVRGADGRVEVRAAGGNARLTLSASGTVAEVDYAVALPPGPGAAATAAPAGLMPPAAAAAATAAWREGEYENKGGGGSSSRGRTRGQQQENPGAAEGRVAANRSSRVDGEGFGGGGGGGSRRVWVTRRFLVGRSAAPPFDDVPPEFSHALSVAVRESQSAAATAAAAVETGRNSVGGGGDFSLGRVGPAAAAVAAAGGTVSRKGGEGGLVAVELPLPEERPDHASWDTLHQGPSLDSHRDPLAPLGYYGDRRRCDSAAPTFAARSATGSASAAAAGGRLLSVDVMELAEGQGYAGELAIVVESTGGCTYRIVVGDGGHHRRAGEGGVGVHVVVHADGSEVWLEGGFVRLVRPPAAAAQQPPRPQRQQQQQQQRLFHVSAASTVRFRVPSPRAEQHPIGRPAAAAVAAASALGAPGIHQGVRATEAAAAEAGGGWTSMSLGAITSRAIALRQQFLRCSGIAATAAAAGIRGAGDHRDIVKIRPPRVVVQPPAALSSPSSSSSPVEAVAGNAAAPRPTTKPYAPPEAGGARWLGSPSSRGGTAAGSPSVVELVERGGASFVAFADGRARGAFADRTIVSLGAPVFYRPLRGSRCGGGGGGGGGGRGISYYGSGGPKGVATAVVRPGCSDVDEEEKEEEDREIECIRADGTVLRLTRHSLDRRGSFGGRSGGGNSPASGNCGVGALRPYVVAVLRFADWAATHPADRRAAAGREAAGRAAAAAEAERNRRFVDLQLLAAKRSVAPPPLLCYHRGGPDQRQPYDGSPSGAAGSRRGGRRSGDEANASPGLWRRAVGVGGEENNDDQDKENSRPRRPSNRVDVLEGSSGVSKWGGGDGGRQRNSLVAGLLEANRKVLMGEDLSRKFPPEKL